MSPGRGGDNGRKVHQGQLRNVHRAALPEADEPPHVLPGRSYRRRISAAQRKNILTQDVVKCAISVACSEPRLLEVSSGGRPLLGVGAGLRYSSGHFQLQARWAHPEGHTPTYDQLSPLWKGPLLCAQCPHCHHFMLLSTKCRSNPSQ